VGGLRHRLELGRYEVSGSYGAGTAPGEYLHAGPFKLAHSDTHFKAKRTGSTRAGCDEPNQPALDIGASTSDSSSRARASTAASMRIGRPHGRDVSPGHLFVASSPILPPSPLTGDAKSR
jgi:hypothetical protein